MAMVALPSWLDLSVDLWVSIYHRLDNLLDRLLFSSVCSLFRSISSSIEDDPIRLSKALLLINLSLNNSQTTHQFFSLTNNKLYSCSIPELQGKWLCGSSNGWLLTMDCQSHSGDMNLFNPLTRSQISLPSISSFTSPYLEQDNYYNQSDRLFFAAKFTMVNTEEDGFMVMVAFTFLELFAFCQTGDTNWTILYSEFNHTHDLMYYDDKLCAIYNGGDLVAWDITTYKKKIGRDLISSSIEEDFRTILRGSIEIPPLWELYRFYLVESLSGELLKICRVVNYEGKYHTRRFRVYKLDEHKNWIAVRSLGDQSLFLGFNQSICLSSLDHPELQADCIYFTYDEAQEGVYSISYRENNVGVYSLKNRTVEPFYPNHPFWTNGCIWITPSLRRNKYWEADRDVLIWDSRDNLAAAS